MIINNVPVMADCTQIIDTLRADLIVHQIPLLGTIKDTPDNIMVSCIYHKGGQERRPSAGIKKDTGIYHCFACGETHTLSEVISNCFGYNDFGQFGWNWLNKKFVTVEVEERNALVLDFGRNNNINTLDNSNYVSEEELDSYRYYHPYMYKRKLTDEIIELFDIGYDRDTECITFPNRDISGNTLFIARRSVKTKFFNYPQGVDKPVYGLYELQKLASDKLNECNVNDLSRWSANEIIICESMLDALTVWTYGKYAVALNGLGTESQFEALKKLPVRKFVLATDMDEAGQRARKRIRKALEGSKLITELIWDVTIAKDINDMSKEQFENLQEIF